MKYPNKTMF